MWRWWLSEACFYALMILSAVGCYDLLRVASAWPAPLTGGIAAGIVFGIHLLGERVTRGLL